MAQKVMTYTEDDIALLLVTRFTNISIHYYAMHDLMTELCIPKLSVPKYLSGHRTFRIDNCSSISVWMEYDSEFKVCIEPTGHTYDRVSIPNWKLTKVSNQYLSNPKSFFTSWAVLLKMLSRKPKALAQLVGYLDQIDRWILDRHEGLLRHYETVVKQYESGKYSRLLRKYMEEAQRVVVVSQLSN